MGRIRKYGVKVEKQLKKELLKYFETTNGQIYKSLKILKIQPSIFYNWKKEDVDFKEDVDDLLSSIRELKVDEAKDQLQRNISKGNQRSLEYFLNTHGKSRGYNNDEKEVVGHEPIQLTIVNPQNDLFNWKPGEI